MTRNVELLQQTMQHIIDHPEQHEQQVFVTNVVTDDYCGTAACFAGWAALLSGWTIEKIKKHPMWFAGANLLGLTPLEAQTLFNSDNTGPMLELMVKDLVNGDEMRSTDDYGFEARS